MDEDIIKVLKHIRAIGGWILALMVLSMFAGCISFMDSLAGI